MEEFTVKRAVEMAITTEQLGADYYNRLERKFGENETLKQIFNRLNKDEQAHEAQFRAILKYAPEDKPEEQQYEKFQFLRATAISEFFNKDYFKDSDDINSPDKALGRALSFEKATLQYYQALRDILGESRELDDIIRAEHGHVVSLMKVIMSDSKFRGIADKW